MDRHLDLPRLVVVAVYERLFDLGVSDHLTRRCYAQYLKLMWGPDRDSEAAEILTEVEPTLEAAGFNIEPGFGHHPTFYASRPGTVR
jgi:hypothetical protein